MPGKIFVALLAAEAALIEADCFIVVDLLRATTTIASLFHRGAEELWAADDVDLARRMARQHDALLVGEVGGLPPEGFDFGNSPAELAATELPNPRAVLFTTNGTTALCALGDRAVVLAGSLANATAVARFASRFERVAVVCAGERGGRRFALEDFAAASAIVARLAAGSPDASLDDGARVAILIASDEERVKSFVRSASHAAALRRLGLGQDIDWASAADSTTCVPRVAECGPGWVRLIDELG